MSVFKGIMIFHYLTNIFGSHFFNANSLKLPNQNILQIGYTGKQNPMIKNLRTLNKIEPSGIPTIQAALGQDKTIQ